jgi:hypothetical protein
MFELFDFDLPGAVTEQLERRLQSMESSALTSQALQDLAVFQNRQGIRQGVYQLLPGQEIVYVGKATNVQERLRHHFDKLRERINLNLTALQFRCLVLRPNWSTSANERLLIEHYRSGGQCKWNSSGFGSKDVGKERDGTEPNRFDREYRINTDYPCEDIADGMTVADLLLALKRQLPFTFRYEVPRPESEIELDLKITPRTARSLIRQAVAALGPDWQATQFPSHIILYRGRRSYPHGEVIPA